MAEALDVSMATVERVRERLVEKRLAAVLTGC
jgi:FixJ family two-component response regulator